MYLISRREMHLIGKRNVSASYKENVPKSPTRKEMYLRALKNVPESNNIATYCT
jgi:hypothetical protein